MAWLLIEGMVAQSIIVVVFLSLSFAYLLRDERRPILFDLVFALAALLAAIGYTSGFIESVTYYDKVTHTFMTFSVSLASSSCSMQAPFPGGGRSHWLPQSSRWALPSARSGRSSSGAPA